MKNELSKNENYRINLESERLLLRNLEPKDKDFIIKLWTNPNVAKYMGGPREKQKMDESVNESLADPFEYEYDLWTLIDKTTNEPVGHCGLLEKEVESKNEIEVIYVIDEPYWGKGFATEIAEALIQYAFNQKGLTRVIALIKPENKGSEKVALKCGMKLEKEVIRMEDIKMYLYVKEKK